MFVGQPRAALVSAERALSALRNTHRGPLRPGGALELLEATREEAELECRQEAMEGARTLIILNNGRRLRAGVRVSAERVDHQGRQIERAEAAAL